MKLFNRTRERVVVEELEIASGFGNRLRGYLFRGRPGPGRGLLLLGVGRVHTLFMGWPLDIHFLDSSLICLGGLQGVAPFRLPPSPRGTRHILETPHRDGKEVPILVPGDRASLLLDRPG